MRICGILGGFGMVIATIIVVNDLLTMEDMK